MKCSANIGLLLALVGCNDDWEKIRNPPPSFALREVVDEGRWLAPLASEPACEMVEFATEPLYGSIYAQATDRKLLNECVRLAERDGIEFASSREVDSFRSYALRRGAVISGRDLTRARLANLEETFFVEIELTKEASQRLHEFTKAHVGDRMAIVMNDNVESAPEIVAPVASNTLSVVVQSRSSGESVLRDLTGK